MYYNEKAYHDDEDEEEEEYDDDDEDDLEVTSLPQGPVAGGPKPLRRCPRKVKRGNGTNELET